MTKIAMGLSLLVVLAGCGAGNFAKVGPQKPDSPFVSAVALKLTIENPGGSFNGRDVRLELVANGANGGAETIVGRWSASDGSYSFEGHVALLAKPKTYFLANLVFGGYDDGRDRSLNFSMQGIKFTVEPNTCVLAGELAVTVKTLEAGDFSASPYKYTWRRGKPTMDRLEKWLDERYPDLRAKYGKTVRLSKEADDDGI